MELVMPDACPECRAARAVTGKPDEEPPGGFTFNQLLVLATIRPPARR
jgi:hypothetical protein